MSGGGRGLNNSWEGISKYEKTKYARKKKGGKYFKAPRMVSKEPTGTEFGNPEK